MKKMARYLLIALLTLAFALSFAACVDNGGGETPTPTKLTMTTPAYSNTTKKVTWATVANASNYVLTLTGEGVNKTQTLTAAEYTVAEDTDGDYSVSIIAKGDGTNYTDSDAKTLDFTYTKTQVVQPTQLVVGELSYNESTSTVSWDEVANASGYTLRVGTSEKAASLITKNGGKMQYVLTESTSGTYTVYVKALGDGENYITSEEKMKTVTYTVPEPEPTKLNAPTNLSIFGANLTWQSVENASGYSVQIDNQQPVSVGTETSFLLLSLIKKGTYSVKVQAIGDGTDYSDSSFSSAIDYKVKPQTFERGSYYTLAIDENGNLWGESSSSTYIGDGTTEKRNTPVQIKAGTKFASVSAGSSQSFAIDESGNLWGWGSNSDGWLGDGTTTNQLSPVQIKAGTKFSSVSTGFLHTLAIDEDGNLWGVGYNEDGQLGDGTRSNRTVFTQIQAGTKFASVSTYYYHTLAIDENGNIWSWGENESGRLGDGTTTDNPNPAQITTGTKFASVSAGSSHSLAIDQSGNLWVWGFNGHGCHGDYNPADGRFIHKQIPTLVENGIKYMAIEAGVTSSFVIDENGNLWAVGSNDHGRLGDGTTITKNFLTQIKAGTKFVSVSTYNSCSGAIDENGNLWIWGQSFDGQSSSTVPVQIKEGTKFNP